MGAWNFGYAAVVGGIGKCSSYSSRGVLSPSSNVPIDVQTRFDLQSITKVIFISTYFLSKLDERPDLLDYEMGLLVENENLAKLSVRSLLNHTTGLTDEMFPNERSSIEVWRKICELEPNADSKNLIQYADMNYKLLGRLVEALEATQLAAVVKNLFGNQSFNFDYVNSKFPSVENIAGGLKNWGRVDDEQDLLLGGCVGCDGLFGSILDIDLYCRWFLEHENWLELIKGNTAIGRSECQGHYEELFWGSKSLGWESNSYSNRYIKWSISDCVLEKAGGGGAFLSINVSTKEYFACLTNHGRPEPFDESNWNKLIDRVDLQRVWSDLLSLF